MNYTEMMPLSRLQLYGTNKRHHRRHGMTGPVAFGEHYDPHFKTDLEKNEVTTKDDDQTSGRRRRTEEQLVDVAKGCLRRFRHVLCPPVIFTIKR